MLNVSKLLFVGDPHVCSNKPGRRLESDNEIIYVTTDKLEQAIEIANQNDALVIILGDLFNKSKDSNPLLLTRVLKALKKSKYPVYCLPGNHDLLATDVTEDTSLAVIEASDKLILLSKSNDINIRVNVNGVLTAIGVTYHDDSIPEDVSSLLENDEKCIWITHHDIAFDGAYPGSLDPHSIIGCQMVVNGHMHRTKPSILKDYTLWVNPGNIFRQTIADANHVPAVWLWDNDMPCPERIVLRYVENVFDWTGKSVKPQMGSLLPEELEEDQDSKFVEQLQASINGEMPKSSNADILLEDMTAIEQETKFKDDIIKIVHSLHKQIVKLN